MDERQSLGVTPDKMWFGVYHNSKLYNWYEAHSVINDYFSDYKTIHSLVYLDSEEIDRSGKPYILIPHELIW